MKLKSTLLSTEEYQSGFEAGVSVQKNLAIVLKKSAEVLAAEKTKTSSSAAILKKRLTLSTDRNC